MVNMGTSVVQITNVAATATHEQMQTLFSFLGEITDLQLYPKTSLPGNQSTKICFIKFQEESCVGVARHLTNTVFIDRPLVCTPYSEGGIPNEELAMTLMPPADSLSSLAGMQGIKIDPAKLDQMQRTIYVGNLDTKTATVEEIEGFFASCGKIKIVKLGGDVTEPIRYCFVEFESEESIKSAMKKNGDKFQGRIIKINQSNNSVLSGGGDNNSREIDEAMRRVRMAQSLISKALDPDKSRKKRSRSRSHSRSRRRHHRSRSRDRSRRRRSRSKGRRRSRSRSHERRRSRRSRSRERRRKRSRSHKRSRSPNKKSSKSRHKDRKRDSDRKRSKHEKGDEKSEDKNKKTEKSPEKSEKDTNGKTADMETK